jgi:hypothetical protein
MICEDHLLANPYFAGRLSWSDGPARRSGPFKRAGPETGAPMRRIQLGGVKYTGRIGSSRPGFSANVNAVSEYARFRKRLFSRDPITTRSSATPS